MTCLEQHKLKCLAWIVEEDEWDKFISKELKGKVVAAVDEAQGEAISFWNDEK